MRYGCRSWSRLSWCIILLVGLTAAVACASHPPGHGRGDSHGDDHDGRHPPFCTDASSPVALVQEKSGVFPDGGLWPLSSKSLFPVVFLSAFGSLCLLSLQVLSDTLSQSDTRTSVSPPMFLVVLRQ
jgi:hypothetical protein